MIRGTRIQVDIIVRKLSEGATEAGRLNAYARLTNVGIQAPATDAAET